MDSIFVMNSAADVLLCATAMWGAICAAVLFADRAPKAEASFSVVPEALPRKSVAREEQTRLAA